LPSRSGLYASDLPGVEELMQSLLSKDEETDAECYDRIYRNAWSNMVSDIENYLQSKFFVNQKLLSRVSSEFREDVNVNTGLAGVRIQFDLPRYARIHIIDLSVFSEDSYPSPEITFQLFEDDENGELLHEVTSSIEVGRNSVNVDTDFDADKIFIAYNPEEAQFRQTENKFYNTLSPIWNKWECMFPCFGGQGSVKQVNGGGISVTYNVICSAEKFVCENINLFRKVFQWRIGLEFGAERRIGNRLNQFTTMTQERKEELFNFYNGEYQRALENSLKSQNITEDPYCFQCKGTVGVKIILP
jgi:hypothetical protein